MPIMCCMGTDSELSAPARCLHITHETSVPLLYILLCKILPIFPCPTCFFQAEDPQPARCSHNRNASKTLTVLIAVLCSFSNSVMSFFEMGGIVQKADEMCTWS